MMFQALGLALGALVVPLIILIIFKATPRFRNKDPKLWYASAIGIAGLLILVSASDLETKVTAALVAAAFLGIGFARDRKRFVQPQ